MKAFAIPAHAFSGDEVLLPIGEKQSLALGEGYDALTDQHFDAIVVERRSDEPLPPIEDQGQRVKADIDVIEDTRAFRETLNISISAAARGFGGRASAHYSLFREVRINSNDVFALLYVLVENATEKLGDPALSTVAKTEWTHQTASNRKSAFVRAFGDSYVSSITTGGEFLALIRIHTSSRSERERVKATAKASFGAFKASGSYEKLTEFFASHTRTSLTYSRVGGEGPVDETNLPSMLEAARNFPDTVNPSKGGKAQQIYFGAKPISRVPDAETNIDLTNRQAGYLLEDIAKLQDEISDRLADAVFAKEAPELFPQVDGAEMDATVAELEETQVNATRICDYIADNRFSSLKDVSIVDSKALPIPPQIETGSSVPLKVSVAIWRNNDVQGAVVDAGEWTPWGGIQGLCIECDDLPEGTFIEYRVCDKDGNWRGWVRAGQSAVAHNALWGVQIRVSGSSAEHFSIRYATKIQRGNAPFYGRDGAALKIREWQILSFKVSLFRS